MSDLDDADDDNWTTVVFEVWDCSQIQNLSPACQRCNAPRHKIMACSADRYGKITHCSECPDSHVWDRTKNPKKCVLCGLTEVSEEIMVACPDRAN